MAKSSNSKGGGKNNNSGGRGFGKTEAPAPPAAVSSMEDVASAIDTSSSSVGGSSSGSSSSSSSSSFLKSVEGGSTAKPQIDDSVPVEDRTKNILREKYGMRTFEEQEEEARKLELAKAQRKKLQEWKKLADEGQDFDLMQILPAPLLIAIDRFLKVGVTICTILFVLAGAFITVEAYSKTTGNPLPADLDKFIVETIEPNFTPGLGVLLGFSVSLGAFAAAQLSSASSNYREDR